ncbi:hypothetical protein N8093_01655 [Planktomarina temperata]|nr:hypothetical protein [Planktomarina temperata]
MKTVFILTTKALINSGSIQQRWNLFRLQFKSINFHIVPIEYVNNSGKTNIINNADLCVVMKIYETKYAGLLWEISQSVPLSCDITDWYLESFFNSNIDAAAFLNSLYFASSTNFAPTKKMCQKLDKEGLEYYLLPDPFPIVSTAVQETRKRNNFLILCSPPSQYSDNISPALKYVEDKVIQKIDPKHLNVTICTQKNLYTDKIAEEFKYSKVPIEFQAYSEFGARCLLNDCSYGLVFKQDNDFSSTKSDNRIKRFAAHGKPVISNYVDFSENLKGSVYSPDQFIDEVNLIYKDENSSSPLNADEFADISLLRLIEKLKCNPVRPLFTIHKKPYSNRYFGNFLLACDNDKADINIRLSKKQIKFSSFFSNYLEKTIGTNAKCNLEVKLTDQLAVESETSEGLLHTLALLLSHQTGGIIDV